MNTSAAEVSPQQDVRAMNAILSVVRVSAPVLHTREL